MPNRLHAILLWFANFWPRNWRETERQYSTLKTQCPHVLADLAQKCHAFEDVHDPEARDRDTWMAIGRRQVWLHIAELSTLTNHDLHTLKEVLDNEHRTSNTASRNTEYSSTSAGERSFEDF